MRLVFNKTNKDIFDFLRSGKKKIETRAATTKYNKIKVGGIVNFSCDADTFQKEIIKVTRFASIDALLKKYKPAEINPKINTKEELIKMYCSFPGYEEKIREFGIVALEFK